MDFMTDLPLLNDQNSIFTMIDKLTKFTCLIPYYIREGALYEAEFSYLFFSSIVRLFGLP